MSLTLSNAARCFIGAICCALSFLAVAAGPSAYTDLQNTVELIGAPRFQATLISEKSLVIAEEGDGVKVTDLPAVGEGDFAVSFWFLMTQSHTGQWRAVLHKGNVNPQRTFAMWLRPDDDRLQFRISTAGNWNDGGDSLRALPLNRWSHIAYVKSGNKLSLYINGVLDNAVMLTGTAIANDGPLYIGASPWNPAAVGRYDHVNVYPRLLTALEVQSLYQQTFADRDLEEQVQLLGDASLVTSAKNFGQALVINNNNAAGVLSHSQYFPTNAADFSLTFWLLLQQDANGEWRTLLHKGDSNQQRSFSLFMLPTDNRLQFRVSTKGNWNDGGESKNKIALNQWTHISLVKQANTLSLYLNGELDTAVTLQGAMIANTGPLYIGATPWTAGAFATYDHLSLFKRPLKKEDVVRVYQQKYLAASQGGQWSDVIPWPHIAVSAANLPDGRVLTWSGSDRTVWPTAEKTYSATFNPQTNRFVELLQQGHNMFCSHLAMTDEGKVLVNGGRNGSNSPWTSLFDFRNNQWTAAQNMATGGRWYPTTLALPSGEVMTAMGSASNVNNPEKWSAAQGWQVLNGIEFSKMRKTHQGLAGPNRWWPTLSVAPSGEVFHFWSPQENFLLNTQSTGSYRKANARVDNAGTDNAPFAPGVTLQYDVGKLLITGSNQGSWNGNASRQAFTVNLNGPTPVIKATSPLIFARKFHNLVLLPTGEVLALGGNTSGQGFSDDGSVYEPEIWSPQTQQWRLAAPMQVPRNYHSIGLLLTDGRVLSAGSGYCARDELCGGASHQNAQIYSPPYLFKADGTAAARPQILSAPGIINAGQTFNVRASPSVRQFTLIKMSATTHAVNTDARFTRVDFVDQGNGQFQLTANANPNVLIPGYWMLFALTADHVPSVAQVIRVDRVEKNPVDSADAVAKALASLTITQTQPQAANQAVTLAFPNVPDLNARLQYQWSFGDGSAVSALSSAMQQIKHVYAKPGVYVVVVTVRDTQTGYQQSFNSNQVVYDAAIDVEHPQRGLSSSPIAFHPTLPQLWTVNPDNNSVAVIDSQSYQKLAEIDVGAQPSSLAFADNGDVWITNKQSSTLSVIDARALQLKSSISLPVHSSPHGIVINHDHAYVVLEASNQIMKFSVATQQIIQQVTVLKHPRHLALSVDGSQLYVSAFITPPLKNESTAAPDVSEGVVGVAVLNTADLSLITHIHLQHSNALTTENTGPGIPNYLGALAMDPNGKTAYLPSKQDNILAGALRGGTGMSFDQTVRAISSKIDLQSQQEKMKARLQHDNASVASAAVYGPYGIYLFTALEGNRQVAVSNTLTGSEIMRFDVGRAPQGLALSADGKRLAVQAFMARKVRVFDISNVIESGGTKVREVANIDTVAQEKLSPKILRGKKLFYDAKDDRLAALDYMSCASCHNDGDQDGRVWDFTQFGEGLRNTTSLRGKAGVGQGLLHWTGTFDEVQDFEGQIRQFAGGLGLMKDADFFAGSRSKPLGAKKAGLSPALDALTAYVSSLKQADVSPLANTTLSAPAQQGKMIFAQQQCASCHAGAQFTDSARGVRHDIGTLNNASGTRLSQSLDGLDTPTLLGLSSSAPYLHNGSAATLQQAIAAHNKVSLAESDLNALARYLLELQ
jgi:hypothetical protein